MKLSKPLLPTELIHRIKSDDMMLGFESDVFTEASHEHRLAMCNWRRPRAPDLFVQDVRIGCLAEMKWTILHLAAYDGDVLAVYEAISTGATVDKATADTSVATPLCLAVAQLALVTSPSVYGLRPDGTSMEAVELIRQASRLKSVIRILVEQHADVRRTMDGQPLIDLVCRSRAWDMITLFLEHGAAPPENLTALFPTASDRAKFTSIPVPKSTGRPARPCPCWSGRIVDECHAKQAQPYPSRYMCVCGSGKAYEKCCLARGSHVLQKWDPTLQRIMSEYEPIPYVTQINIHPGGGQEFGERLKALGIVDPAFSYACTRSQFVPTPLSRTGSRYVAESRQKEWNAFVDEYIDTQGDQRSREDIERAAKIGTWGGALVRTCEGPGCTKIEGVDGPLKLCTRCKMAVYCGSVCQSAAWKQGGHKTVCNQEGQKEQTLPSQDRLFQVLRWTRSRMNESNTI